MNNTLTTLFLILVITFFSGCEQTRKTDDSVSEGSTKRTIGFIERMDPKISDVLAEETAIEILASGFEWSEGPVWIPEGDFLLFSDIPPNRVYKWTEEDSISIYLEPSGYTGSKPRDGEPGSNGLLLNPDGKLVLCQHGDRRVAVMEATLGDPRPEYRTLVESYEGKRLNSPNDAVFHENGDLYFTDPPYGLEGNVNDPAKELGFQGVFRLSKDGELTLLTDTLTRPNGIGFSPDHKTLYVANSDPGKAWWAVYDVGADGTLESGRIFYDATDKVGEEKGLPDGLAVKSDGLILATGPGGVWIFQPDGTHLGTINTTQATANCTFNEDETMLYITADMYLLRVKIK